MTPEPDELLQAVPLIKEPAGAQQWIADAVYCIKALEQDVARYRNALHCISLGSQNSMTSKEALGREARQALHDTEAK